MNIALISVRGGSVRLPGKNKKLLCGLPLFVWTELQAFYSHEIDFVLFTTDDKEMWNIFADNVPKNADGSPVKSYDRILRPVYDNDTAINRPYLEAVQENGKKIHGFKDDDLLMTMFATSPTRHPHDIDNTIEAWYLNKDKYDQLTWFAPDREIQVFKNEKPMPQQFGKAYYAEPVLFDKHWNYSIQAGGTACYPVGKAVEWWTAAGWSDREIDAKMKDPELQKQDAKNKRMGCYSVYPYQAIECDYEYLFYVVEGIMEKYILKGHGPNIYRDYYEGHI